MRSLRQVRRDASGDAEECSDFFDFYHQNAAGRARFDAWLRPQLEPMLDVAAKQKAAASQN